MGETISPSLAFAIDLLRKRSADLDAAGIWQRLTSQGWDVDEQLVRVHLGELSAVVPPKPVGDVPSLERPSHKGSPSVRANTWCGVPLGDLPVDVRNALVDLPDALPAIDSVPPERQQAPEWAAVLEDMRAALRSELAEVRQTSREGRVPLQSGDMIGKTSRGYTVRFVMDGDAPIAEGAFVHIRYGAGVAVEAEVLQVADSTLTLWVSGPAPTSLGDAVLVVDASFLIDLRLEFLSKLMSPDRNFDTQSAVSVLTSGADDPEAAQVTREGLSADQRAFVGKALTPGLTWLWGPPGTGKTTTLAHLLVELLKSSKRVLFVSNTNAAVDTALLRFMDVDVDSERRVGEVLRLGHPVLDDVRDPSKAAVTLDGIAAAQGVKAGAALTRCESDLKRTRTRLREAQIVLKDPIYARDKGMIGTAGMDYPDLLQLIEQQDVHGRERALSRDLGQLVDTRKALRDLIEVHRELTIRTAGVVFATVHRTYLKDLTSERFDVVIIDEASMVSTDLAVIAAGLSGGHVVIAGDFRQLGPIAQADSTAAKHWLHNSVFEASGVSARVETGDIPANLVALKTQHRMQPAIATVIGRGFYPEIELATADAVRTRARTEAVKGLRDLTIVDTSALRPWQAKRNGMYSRFNVVHAQVVDSLLATVGSDHSIGAITPYAPQAQLLRSLLGQSSTQAAATVHRFQGGECDTVIWDMTEGRAGGAGIAKWFEAVRPADTGSRLINVALSRARDQLIIVADLERAGMLGEATRLRKTLNQVRRLGTVIDARELLPTDAGRTRSEVGTAFAHPIESALTTPTTTLTVWSSMPPSQIDPAALVAIRGAIRRGVRVYLRVGVPTRSSQWECLARLQQDGCQVQLVRPCWENLVLTDTSVLTSSASLLSVGELQRWTRSQHGDFAGVVGTLVRRRGDADPKLGDRDPTCERGHPLLVDVVLRNTYRSRCLRCQREVGGGEVRSGRSRARHAATAVPSCGSCGTAFGIDGRCGC